MLRPKFIQKCELWRVRQTDQDVYQDVYDGNVWKNFLEYDGVPFLSLPFNFGFSLNIDWFQPFKHTKHAEGAAYLTILNLPREERYLQENMILLGVIPGPKEPSLTMNTLLEPFVKEMIALWEGIVMTTADGMQVLVRGALLCCNCDTPASRKVCGFVACSAYHGCPRCLLAFPTASFGDKADYTNVDGSQWTPRTLQDHKIKALAHKNCNTQTARDVIERDSGVRYSILNELPYFDAPRMLVVDPMHNLFLGTAKHMVEVWKSLKFLTDKDFVQIQRRVDCFTTPNDLGRIPSKIASNFSGFTAEQWKNWTVFFSLYALKDILPARHYNCWHLFVKACYHLCRRRISLADTNEADRFLMEFYEEFVTLYGKDWCTPNMHLHGHLHECVKDYGPVYSFWLFSFERFNGILGSYHTNSHNISIQLMRRFLDSRAYAPCNWPKDYRDVFIPVLEKFQYQKGSLQQESFETANPNATKVIGLSPIQEDGFNPLELSEIQKVVAEQHPNETFEVAMLYNKANAIVSKDIVIGSSGCRHSNASIVLVGESSTLGTQTASLCEIQYFAECRLTQPSGESQSFWVAAIQIFMAHPCKMWYGDPVQVWSTVPNSIDIQYVPVSSIASRVVFSKTKVDFGRNIGEDNVYVVIPLKSK